MKNQYLYKNKFFQMTQRESLKHISQLRHSNYHMFNYYIIIINS